MNYIKKFMLLTLFTALSPTFGSQEEIDPLYTYNNEYYESSSYTLSSPQGTSSNAVTIPKCIIDKTHLELMPFLPDGYRWKQTSIGDYEMVKHEDAPEHNIRLILFGDERQGFDYLTVIDGQTHQSVAIKPQISFTGQELRDTYPMKSEEFQLRTVHGLKKFIRGHMIDFNDTKEHPHHKYLSTLSTYNFHPEPSRDQGTYSPWGQTYRRLLVGAVLENKHYVQHNFFDDNSLQLPSSHHIPQGIIFQAQDSNDTFTRYSVPWNNHIHKESTGVEKASKHWKKRLAEKYKLQLPKDRMYAPLPVFYTPHTTQNFSNLYGRFEYTQRYDWFYDKRYINQVAADREYNALEHKYHQLLFDLKNHQTAHFDFHATRFENTYEYLVGVSPQQYISSTQFDLLAKEIRQSDTVEDNDKENYIESLKQSFNNQTEGSCAVRPSLADSEKSIPEDTFLTPSLPYLKSDSLGASAPTTPHNKNTKEQATSAQQIAPKIVEKGSIHAQDLFNVASITPKKKRSLIKEEPASYSIDMKGKGKNKNYTQLKGNLEVKLKNGGALTIQNICTAKAGQLAKNQQFQSLNIPNKSVDVYFSKNGRNSNNNNIANKLKELKWVKSAQLLVQSNDRSSSNANGTAKAANNKKPSTKKPVKSQASSTTLTPLLSKDAFNQLKTRLLQNNTINVMLTGIVFKHPAGTQKSAQQAVGISNGVFRTFKNNGNPQSTSRQTVETYFKNVSYSDFCQYFDIEKIAKALNFCTRVKDELNVF